MTFVARPKFLWHTRAGQFLVSLLFIILAGHSYRNRHYWQHLEAPLGVGAFATFLTWAIAFFGLYTYYKTRQSPSVLYLPRQMLELLALAAWIAVLGLTREDHGTTTEAPAPSVPKGTWDAATAMSAAMVASFLVTNFSVFDIRRGAKEMSPTTETSAV